MCRREEKQRRCAKEMREVINYTEMPPPPITIMHLIGLMISYLRRGDTNYFGKIPIMLVTACKLYTKMIANLPNMAKYV